MSEPVTGPTSASVEAFIAALEPPRRQQEARQLLDLMTRATGSPPVMFGPNIIGFEPFQVRNDSGRLSNWFVVGFSPRKGKHVLYVMDGFDGHDALLAKLGKHSTGKACLYVNKLADVDVAVLEELVRASVAAVRARRESA